MSCLLCVLSYQLVLSSRSCRLRPRSVLWRSQPSQDGLLVRITPQLKVYSGQGHVPRLRAMWSLVSGIPNTRTKTLDYVDPCIFQLFPNSAAPQETPVLDLRAPEPSLRYAKGSSQSANIPKSIPCVAVETSFKSCCPCRSY